MKDKKGTRKMRKEKKRKAKRSKKTEKRPTVWLRVRAASSAEL
jgi:hypothetical protein